MTRYFYLNKLSVLRIIVCKTISKTLPSFLGICILFEEMWGISCHDTIWYSMRKENLEHLEHKQSEERRQNNEFCEIVCAMQERQIKQIFKTHPSQTNY